MNKLKKVWTATPNWILIVMGIAIACGGTVITAPVVIPNNAVTDAKLRDSVGLSVIGRSVNTTGDPGNIVAGVDGDVLRLSGTTLGFGAIPEGSVTGVITAVTAGAGLTGGATSGDATVDITASSDFSVGADLLDLSTTITAPGTLDTVGDFSVATNKFNVTAASGNTTVAGTLGATGDFKVNTNKFTVTASSGNTLVAGTLDSTGNFKVNTNKFTVAASSGDTLVAGALDVTSDFRVNTNKFTVSAPGGNTLVGGTLDVTSDLAVNTSKFTVVASNGNTLAAGTLSATGNFAVNTNKFNVTASTGATSLAGQLVGGATAITKAAFTAGGEITRDASVSLIASSYGTSVTPEHMVFHGRGTGASTTALLSGDALGQYAFTGASSATAIFSGALIQALTTENWAVSANGTQLLFFTTPPTTGTRAQVMMLDDDGQAAFGPAAFTPDASVNMHVRRADASGVPAANSSTVLEVENSAATYITISAADSSDHGILFARSNSNADGSILYDNSSTTRGFDFRTGGNTSRMTIDSSGNVVQKFDSAVNGNATLGDAATDSHTVNGLLTVTRGANTGIINGSASSTTTSIGNHVAAFKISNIDSTNNNWTALVFGSTSSTAAASIEAQNVDATLHYADINFATRAADGYLSRAKITSAGAFSTNGNTTLGDAVGDTTTVAGVMGVNGASAATNAITVTGPASGTGMRINNASAGQTSANGSDMLLVPSGTFDSTAGALIHSAVRIVSSITRSAGANTLTQIGGSFELSSGQTDNRAVNASATGATTLANYGVFSSASGSSGTNYSFWGAAGKMENTGDFAINTNKFTVTASNGNTLAAGTLTSTGEASLGDNDGDGGYAITTSNNDVTFRGITSHRGHMRVTGTALVNGDLSTCGGGTPTASGTDVAGRITEGTTATACTLTFKATWTSAPYCVCSSETAGVAVTCVATATTLIFSNLSASGDVFTFVCMGTSSST